jgi:hypothetical protein
MCKLSNISQLTIDNGRWTTYHRDTKIINHPTDNTPENHAKAQKRKGFRSWRLCAFACHTLGCFIFRESPSSTIYRLKSLISIRFDHALGARQHVDTSRAARKYMLGHRHEAAGILQKHMLADPDDRILDLDHVI